MKALAEEAVAQGGVVMAVSLDIANAFNTLPWSCVKEALKYHRVPQYLQRLVDAYLSGRSVEYPGREGWESRDMSCGVPQGSVLGPLLWNIGYDWVLRGTNPRGVSVVCYADDTLVLAKGENYREAALHATAGVANVVGRIRCLGLEVALSKSEALCFHGPRKGPPRGAHLIVGGVRIGVEGTMKYLGLVLDSRWDFGEHIRRLAPRLMAAASALGGLLPNLGDPDVSCRRLYAGVVRSMALYGFPVWTEELRSQSVALLRKPQRAMAIRVVRGYRTISNEAACVLAGSLPWDLDAGVLASLFHWREEARGEGMDPAPQEVQTCREDLHRQAVDLWAARLERPTAGRRTVEAIRPVLRQWLDRPHGVLTFRVTQILSGHGCFGGYLCNIAGREPSEVCHHCDVPSDDAQHTLESCSAWAEERRALSAVIGDDLSLPAVARAIVGSDRAWVALQTFCEDVMLQKEAAERIREETSTLAIRRLGGGGGGCSPASNRLK